MRVTTFVDLKQSRDEIVEHDKSLKWVVGQADSENRAIIYIKDIQNDSFRFSKV